MTIAGAVDQSGKHPPGHCLIINQLFRVPLHTQGKGMIRLLDRFDQPISSPGDHSERVWDFFDGLMVQAVDWQARTVHNFR